MATKTLIRSARVLDTSRELHSPAVADILVDGNSICAVGTNLVVAGAEVIDANGMLAVPGFINAHYHSHDALARGMFEELTLEHWSAIVGPMGGRRSLEEVRARTLAGAVESLRNGITTVQDMSSFLPASDEVVDAILDAYAHAGIRVILSVMLRDVPPVDTVPWAREIVPNPLHDVFGVVPGRGLQQIEFAKRQVKRIGDRQGMVRWALSPSAPHRCTRDLLEAIAQLSAELRLPIYTHVYESRAQRVFGDRQGPHYGGSILEYMSKIGLLGSRTTIAHGVWFGEGDQDLIAQSGTNVVLNMLSNLKLKSGVAPILGYRKRGVNLALGTDNCSCSDVQSMQQVMKSYCLLSAVSSPDAIGVTAAEALRAATVGGARTAGLEGEIGAIRPGFKADILLIDSSDPAYIPLNSAVRQLVYSDSGRAIHTVIVNGEVVVRNGRSTRVDELALQSEIESLMPKVRADLNAANLRYREAKPYLDEIDRRVRASPLAFDRFLPLGP